MVQEKENVKISDVSSCAPHRDTGMALLDEAGGGGYRFHWGTGLHVRAVQSLHPAVAETKGLQPRHIRAEPARDV